MSSDMSKGFKPGLIFFIHKFHSLQKRQTMAEKESGQGSQSGSRSGSQGGSKSGSQSQSSKTSRKSSGKEDEKGGSSSGRGGRNK